jgi:hypothetical protein
MSDNELREQITDVKGHMDKLFKSKLNDYKGVIANFRPQDIVTTFMYKNDNPNKLIVIVLKNADNIEIPVWNLNFVDFFNLHTWIEKKLKNV